MAFSSPKLLVYPRLESMQPFVREDETLGNRAGVGSKALREDARRTLDLLAAVGHGTDLRSQPGGFTGESSLEPGDFPGETTCLGSQPVELLLDLGIQPGDSLGTLVYDPSVLSRPMLE